LSQLELNRFELLP